MRRKYKFGGDPKKTSDSIINKIDELAAQGVSYDDIIKAIDPMLILKDKQQEQQEQQTTKTENRMSDIIRGFKYGGKLRKYNYGGAFEQQGADLAGAGAGLAAQSLNLALPGLGSAVSPAASMLAEELAKRYLFPKAENVRRNRLDPLSNPYGGMMKYGGKLSGREDASIYKGKLHRNGGIMVNSKGVPSSNAAAEVEGGEVKVGNYIFSDTLKL